MAMNSTVADPKALYVTAVVIISALCAWVAYVLAKVPKRGSATTPSPVRAAELSLDDAANEDQPTGPIARILVSAVAQTDPGLRRKQNEDAFLVLDETHLYAVADGMGRHAAGEIASSLCIEELGAAYEKNDFGTPQKGMAKRLHWLKTAIDRANTRVLSEAKANDAYEGMGTTVVAVHFARNRSRVYIAHVGDSRCYRLRAGTLTQLTHDHTLGAAGIEGAHAHFLSRAVGLEDTVEVDLTADNTVIGDVYLLCSDGLSRMVPEPEIAKAIAKEDVIQRAADRLVALANERGGRDNVTVILVRVDAP